MDGEWRLQRLGGLLPPLRFMRKEIADTHGRTVIGKLLLHFDVEDNELHYRFPLKGLVDVVEPGPGNRRRGRARLFGCGIGSFLMIRQN
jgi:hypothetical protein